MATWFYEMLDGSRGSIEKDTLEEAYNAMRKEGEVAVVYAPPAPPVAVSPGGIPFVISVDDEGVVTATPVVD